MKPVVKYVIADVNMGVGHQGLDLIVEAHKKSNKLFAQTIKKGGLILFVNRKMNRCKLFSHGGEVVGYLRLYGGRRLTQATVNLIPETFGGSVEYADSVKSAFTRFFEAEEAKKKSTRAKTLLLA